MKHICLITFTIPALGLDFHVFRGGGEEGRGRRKEEDGRGKEGKREEEGGRGEREEEGRKREEGGGKRKEGKERSEI